MTTEMHAAAVMFGNHHGEVLVLHRHADLRDGDTWGLVGGVVEVDDVESMLIAKVKQEIGISLARTALTHLQRYRWQRTDEWGLTFDAYGARLGDDAEIVLDPEGHDDYAWKQPAELVRRTDLIPGLRQVIRDHHLLLPGLASATNFA